MTNEQSPSAVDQDSRTRREPRPAFMRLVFAVPLAVIVGFIGLVALSWAGWGTETDPLDQLRRDAPWLLVVAAAGASAGGLVAWGLVGKRWFWIHLTAAASLLPAAVTVTAYFTDMY
jgi:hypothetical protein